MMDFWFPILSFTLLQASLSALLSCGLGLVLGRVMARYPSALLAGLVKSLGRLTFVLPVMIPALAWLILFEGHFGLWPIVAVHVALNLPYCLGQVEHASKIYITEAHERQGHLLRLSWGQRLWFLERPLLMTTLKTTFLMVFSACLASFSAVLLLGGGPAATTVSVAIYSSLAMGYHPGETLFFSALHMVLIVPLTLVLFQGDRGFSRAFPSAHARLNMLVPWWITGLMGILGLLYLAPFLTLLGSLSPTNMTFKEIVPSILITLGLGLSVAGVTFMGALWILGGRLLKSTMPSKFFSVSLAFLIGIPKIVLVSFLFVIAHGVLTGPSMQFLSILGISVVCYLPYVLKTFYGDMKMLSARYQSLIALHRLGFKGILEAIIYPHLGPKIKTHFAIVVCFAMGNLTIPLILGQGEIKTLPVLSYHFLLKYSLEEASFCLSLLVGIMGFVFWILKGKRYAQF